MLHVYCRDPECEFGQIHDFDYDKQDFPKYMVGEMADKVRDDVFVNCLEHNNDHVVLDRSKMAILKNVGTMVFNDVESEESYTYNNVYVVEQMDMFTYDNLLELHRKLDKLYVNVSNTNRLLEAIYEIKQDQCCILM